MTLHRSEETACMTLHRSEETACMTLHRSEETACMTLHRSEETACMTLHRSEETACMTLHRSEETACMTLHRSEETACMTLHRSEETACMTLHSFLKQDDETHSDDVQAISKGYSNKKPDHMYSMKYKFCGLQYIMKKEECPAFRKQCKACKKMNHFAAVCKQRATHQIDSNHESVEQLTTEEVPH